MRIILCQDVNRLGKAGDTVEVKDGYARNYLLPKGIALLATQANIKRLETESKQKEFRKNRALKKATELAEKINKLSLTIPMQVGEEDKVFGAVTSQEIAQLLADKGYSIDKKQIQLDEPIKALGIYEVPIKLHTEVNTAVKLWVIKA